MWKPESPVRCFLEKDVLFIASPITLIVVTNCFLVDILVSNFFIKEITLVGKDQGSISNKFIDPKDVKEKSTTAEFEHRT